MAEPDKSKLFRTVNQSLGQQPSLGPIPTNLLAPSGGILVTFYLLLEVILGVGFVWFLLLSVWGISTWWIVVGERIWKFTNKFVAVPDWNRGPVHYTPCLQQDDYHKTTNRQ
jgi:hypothetical protein